MKSLLIVLVLATLTAMVVCDNFQQLTKVCLAETRTSEAELKDFFRNGMKDADAKDNIKCHLKCMMEKQGHLKNGIFNEAAALKSLKEIPQLKDHLPELQRAVQECKNERGINDCDTAYKITTCIKDQKSSMKS